MRTGAHIAATTPALAAVELGDEPEQSVVGGADLTGEEGDFPAQGFIVIEAGGQRGKATLDSSDPGVLPNQ